MAAYLTPDSVKWLDRLSKEYPKDVRRAYGLACSIVRRRMVREMRGGRKSNLPKWAAETKAIRKLQGNAYSETFGGRLVWPDYKQIAMYQVGDSTKIGWIGALEPYAIRFEDGGTQATSKSWRHWLYSKGVDKSLVPQVAITPPRPVVDPVAMEARAHFAEWVEGSLRRILEGKIKGASLRYENSQSAGQAYRYAKRAAGAAAAIAHMDKQEAMRRDLI